jgi:hypothetical protein
MTETATPNSQSQFFEIVRKFIQRLGDPSKWTFEGEIIDLGAPTGKCTCDHPIRYVFVIHGPEGRTAPVGSECINHFQAYNPELWQKMNAALDAYWERIRATEKAAREAQQQKEAAEAKIPYETARQEAWNCINAYKQKHPASYWLPSDLYSLRCKLTAPAPQYKRTKSYITFYQRETKEMYTLIVRHLNMEAGQ